MKNLIRKSLVLVVLFTTLLGNANEISIRNLNDSKTTLLTLANVKQGNQLLIKDSFGIVLYKESIEKSGEYNKGFDLTSLPEGDYFFELNKGFEIKVIPFNLSYNAIEFNKDNEVTIFKPHVKIKENFVYVTQLSANKKPVAIDLYYFVDGYYQLIHSEVVENKQRIEKVYSLDKNLLGKYKIEFKTEGKTFVEYFETFNTSTKSKKHKKNKVKSLVDSRELKKGNEERIISFKEKYYSQIQNN